MVLRLRRRFALAVALVAWTATGTLAQKPPAVPDVLQSARQAPARPDFSGTWTFDRTQSAEPWNGRIVIAAILGDQCVATQDARALTLAITVGGQKVTAVYAFQGESRNISPGDIPVTSRTSWDGQRLVIVSTSPAVVKGRDVTIETRRVMWIDRGGNLIIERTGTPASEVTPSRSIYTRGR